MEKRDKWLITVSVMIKFKRGVEKKMNRKKMSIVWERVNK